EIWASSFDYSMPIFQLTCLISEMGLNIQEAHAFCTIDGYSLDVFVVDSWETDMLLRFSILLFLKCCFPKQPPSSLVETQQNCGTLREKNRLSTGCDSSDVWEIDANMLNFEYKIASGSNGDLYKGVFQCQDVAIKVLKVESLNEDMKKEFAQEVNILRKVRHKNIVRFICACTRPPLLCIVTEFMRGGSVYDFLHKQKGVFNLSTLLKIAADVSKGMTYLHQNNIIHRDLKAANLLMDENETVKIADFGIARVQIQSGIMTAETGTYRWMAPEIIEHKPYNHKADVFSFGILLWELLTGKLPYSKLTPLQAAVGVVQQASAGLRPKIPKHGNPMLVELLQRCWQQEPSLRPEFTEIMVALQCISKKV
ncbi:hypothetical protein M569_00412, partial [Genlisea aurea]